MSGSLVPRIEELVGFSGGGVDACTAQVEPKLALEKFALVLRVPVLQQLLDVVLSCEQEQPKLDPHTRCGLVLRKLFGFGP